VGFFRRSAVETRADTYSLADPALAAWLGVSGSSASGINVTETSALGFTAVYRAVEVIAGTIAGLPLHTYRTDIKGHRDRVPSFLDDPGRYIGLTPFEWRHLVLVHLLLHGNAYLRHILNGAGAVVGLDPIHPLAVTVERAPNGAKRFKVAQQAGPALVLTEADLTHVMGLSTDGLRGVSPIATARNAIGTGVAGDRAAGKMFRNGLLLSGSLTSEADDTDEAEGLEIVEKVRDRAGHENAGDVVYINRSLKFTPWSMTSRDAQFVESRAFQIEEVSRLFGVPKVLLSQDGASTWGSGIAELLRAMSKFTLQRWSTPLDQALSRLLPAAEHVETEYAALLQGTPAEEIDLLLRQVEAGFLTRDEARAIRNLPPLPASEVPA
jgi:HK97 family phage portal protein